MESDSRPRLLVVSYHFPSSGSVGALRWWGLSKYLLRMGWRVRVVSAFPPPESLPEGDLAIHAVPPERTLHDRYRAWRLKWNDRGRRPSASKGGGRDPWSGCGPAPGWLSRLASYVRQELAALLGFPDEGRGWIIPAAKEARRVAAAFDPHVVVSSGPPHSAHLAARWAVGRRQLRWFMDYRDPWASHQAFSPFTGWLMHRLERRMLRHVSGALTTTPEFREVLSGEAPEVDVRWLSNGVDPSDMAHREGKPPGAGFVVSHVGSVYSTRDPSGFLKGAERFVRSVPEAVPDFRIRFVGPVSPPYDGILEEARAGSLSRHLELVGSVPRQEALGELAASSVALVLAPDQGLMVPAKIFESVGMGVPTLAITEPGSATAHAARRLGAEVADPDDPAEVAAALERLWERRGRRQDPPAAIRYDHLAKEAARILLGR